MAIESKFWNRFTTGLGFVCLVMTLLLLSPGVRVVRAEDAAETVTRVEPAAKDADGKDAVKSPARATATAAPARDARGADATAPPGQAGVEIEPGVIVLNTRGYNYGPPIEELDPAALRVESDER